MIYEQSWDRVDMPSLRRQLALLAAFLAPARRQSLHVMHQWSYSTEYVVATIVLAKSPFTGNAKYQLRARRAFPLLVRQAKAKKEVTYEDFARELGISNPRTLNYVLGSVAQALVDVESVLNEKTPHLTALVVNKGTGLPGDGLMLSMFKPEVLEKATKADKKRLVAIAFEDVFKYAKWDSILAHYGLKGVTTPFIPPVVEVRGGGPESAAHIALKQFVFDHPSSVGVPTKATREKEACLRSGDRVDVFFQSGAREWVIEVKTADATLSEVVRGLFQCVKYEAVLEAEARVSHSRKTINAYLVLGGSFPEQLAGLRNSLGIRVVENVGATVRTTDA